MRSVSAVNEIATSTRAAPSMAVPTAARMTVAQMPGHPSANGVTATVSPGRNAPNAISPARNSAPTIAAGTRPSAMSPGRRGQ